MWFYHQEIFCVLTVDIRWFNIRFLSRCATVGNVSSFLRKSSSLFRLTHDVFGIIDQKSPKSSSSWVGNLLLPVCPLSSRDYWKVQTEKWMCTSSTSTLIDHNYKLQTVCHPESYKCQIYQVQCKNINLMNSLLMLVRWYIVNWLMLSTGIRVLIII